jgi:hypothetical protein
LTTAWHWLASVPWVTFAGQVIDGAWVSLTVTVKLQLGPTVVEQVTVVVPFGKVAPDAGLQLTVPQVPVVVGAGKFTTAPHWFGSLFCVTFAGQVIVQGTMDTVKEQLPVRLTASVAVQITVVVPTAKQVLGGGVHTTLTPAQLSLPVGGV